MEEAESVPASDELASAPATTRASRAVPADWYVDPADPEAIERYQQELDDAATQFLNAHEAFSREEMSAELLEFPLEADHVETDQNSSPDTVGGLSTEALEESGEPRRSPTPDRGQSAPKTRKPGAGRTSKSGQANGVPWVGVSLIDTFLDEESELSWQADALCAQTDPEAFFPEKGGSTRDAKKVCGECTVREQCLEYALANDERFGIWGGLSERERRKLRKRAV